MPDIGSGACVKSKSAISEVPHGWLSFTETQSLSASLCTVLWKNTSLLAFKIEYSSWSEILSTQGRVEPDDEELLLEEVEELGGQLLSGKLFTSAR